MLSNLSNNNAGNTTKSVVEKKKYEDIEKRIDEMQEEIDATAADVSTNSQAISNLNDRVDAVEDNSTFPELNTDTINPATGDKVEITSDLDVDGEVEASSVKTNSLSVNGTNFNTVKDDAAQAKSTAESAKDKADEAYDLADAVADELADYKADNEASITTGTLNADSVVTDSIAAQTINTNDFETTNAEIDKLYVDTIKATGFLELPTSGQQYYTITVPAKTTASFSGVYTSDNNTDYPYYFTVSDGAVIYKQGSTEIIKDISFDRETGYTKVRVKSSTNLTYISSALDSNPVTIEDGGDAYTDYAFIPQKTGGYLIRGYDDTTTEVYIAGVLRAYAMSVEEEIIERTSVDFLKVNASIELPKDWDAGGTISYSTGEENEYISAQTKAGVTKPTWTSPIHSTIGSLSYSSKLVDEATVASYKGISETRQTQTITITDEASLQQLTAFHWTKNGNYWQPYELTRITIGDNTMWIDPTEANQGIRFNNNQVIADGTWEDVPVEEANAVPVNLVIFDAPTELSFPITNLGDRTTVHGEITATCFKGNVLGNVTGNADTATNATCFDSKTYAEAKADILSGCAADSNMFNGKTYSEAKADILTGNAASATNATCFNGKTYAEAKADILSGCAASAGNATCFDGKTYADAKADILSGCAASADNATCFDGKTYAEAKTDILTGTSAQAHCVDIDSLTTNSYPLVMESTTCELGKSGTCPITFTPSTGILETNQVSTSCIENSGTIQSQCLCATCDINVDGNAYITGDLTVQGTITTTHSEEVVTPSENIILRDGATTPVASGCYSGFTVTNYDGQANNLEIGADKDGTLHVGVVGGTMEPIATRATEACMEDGYAAHWDSTGTDLVTKGATNTHDLTVNGNASVTGNLSVTGTLTADLTGTADNATKFDNKTYSEAKADILSGCAADSAKLGNKEASCYIDNSSTAQTKAGALNIGAPAACTTTSAGGTGVINGTSGGINLYAAGNLPYIHFHYNKYCGEYSTRLANTKGRLAITVNDGEGCTAAENSNIFDFCSDGTFKGAKCICGTNIYQNGNKVIDASSTTQTKAGNLCIGAPAACTSTSAGGNGSIVSSLGAITLYKEGSPYIDFHYDKYCGGYSSRICNSHTSSDNHSSLDITVNNGVGCTQDTECATYCFKSDGTFTGACTICASTNVYSAGCPVVTTGNIATVAPGYNCTGTSNYVVTTMVCCAKQICRNTANAGTCYLALFGGNAASNCASLYVSNGCPLTYSPSTGVLATCCVVAGNTNPVRSKTYSAAHGAYSLIASNKVSSGIVGYTSMELTLFSMNRTDSYPVGHIFIDFSSGDSSNAWSIQGFTDININDSSNVNYPRIVVSKDTENYNIYVQSTYSYEKFRVEYKLLSNDTTIPDTITATDSPSGTTVFDSSTDKTKIVYVKNVPSAMSVDVCTSSSNAEYPLVFSTCCATPAAGNRTLYNDSANNLMYNPSTNHLMTTCVRGICRIYAGCPLSCTASQSGVPGVAVRCDGIVGLSAVTPSITFAVNNTCAEYTHRIIANNGYLRVTATNATGCTAANQTANFDFCSDGTFSANKLKTGLYSNKFEYYKSDNSGRSVLHLLYDMTCAVCCTNCGYSMIGTVCGNRTPTQRAKSSIVDYLHFSIVTNYAPTGIAATCSYILSGSNTQYITPVVVCRNDGKIYAAVCISSSGRYIDYDVSGSSGVICEVLRNTSSNFVDSAGCTYTIAKEGSLAEITSCVSNATNATCFGGCTYAQAKADIAGSVETTPYTCINDVNSGSQDILMTSSTGTLGVVNASTGTNACPLKYNPATGVLTACSFIVCSNESLAVVSKGETALGKGATAIHSDVYLGSTAIGYEALAQCASVAIGGYAQANAVDGIAIGTGACSCCYSGIAIGGGADAFASSGVALGGTAGAACACAIAIGNTACAQGTNAIAIGYCTCVMNSCGLAIGCKACAGNYSNGFVVFKDIRYSGYRETTFCIPDSMAECLVYKILNNMFCSNPSSPGCPGYGHSTWPAFGIRGCSCCFYGGANSGTWGGTGCKFWNIGGTNFTDGCTCTVGCNYFVTVIAPSK